MLVRRCASIVPNMNVSSSIPTMLAVLVCHLVRMGSSCPAFMLALADEIDEPFWSGEVSQVTISLPPSDIASSAFF